MSTGTFQSTDYNQLIYTNERIDGSSLYTVLSNMAKHPGLELYYLEKVRVEGRGLTINEKAEKLTGRQIIQLTDFLKNISSASVTSNRNIKCASLDLGIYPCSILRKRYGVNNPNDYSGEIMELSIKADALDKKTEEYTLRLLSSAFGASNIPMYPFQAWIRDLDAIMRQVLI